MLEIWTRSIRSLFLFRLFENFKTKYHDVFLESEHFDIINLYIYIDTLRLQSYNFIIFSLLLGFRLNFRQQLNLAKV